MSTGDFPIFEMSPLGHYSPMLEEIVARINRRLEKLGLTESAAAIAAGKSDSLIRDMRRGLAGKNKGVKGAKVDSLAALAPILQTTVGWLAAGEGPEEIDGIMPFARRVPIVSWVAASGFAEANSVTDSETLDHVSVAELADGAYIALKVKGDSMNLVAPEGSTIIVNCNDKELIDRRFYVVASEDGGETTFKRYLKKKPPILAPCSTNTDHDAINIESPIKVIGRAIRVIHEL